MAVKNDNWVRTFLVSDPNKHDRGFTIYKVTSIVYPRLSPEALTSVTVWKRFNDFKRLHNDVKVGCKKLQILEPMPKFPRGKIFNRFEDEIVQERIKAALSLLEFIGRHSLLFTSDAFNKFFENGYPLASNTNCLRTNIDNANVVSNVKHEPVVCANDNVDEIVRNKDVTHWNYQPAQDVISLSSHSLSDDCTTYNSDTTESSCQINTPLQQSDLQFFDPLHPNQINNKSNNLMLLSNNNISSEFGIDCIAIQMSQSSDEHVNSYSQKDVMSKSMSFLPGNVGETVICHSEKPVKPSEMWLSVRTQDFSCMKNDSLAPGLTDSEAWLTPPGTPAGRHDYLVDAAYHIGEAQTYDAAGEYEAAFSYYKAAIACLLSGVQDDENKSRRKAVRDKTAQYLHRAEQIYHKYLVNNNEPHKQSVFELKSYKVLGVVKKVMLVLHTEENKLYIIKVLEKSPCPVNTRRKTIIPKNVPYMVQLIAYYETECCVYLVLQYGSGGSLWDHIDNYLQSVPHTPVKQTSHLLEQSPKHNNDVQLTESLENERSYLDLIRSYTSMAAKHMFGYEEPDLTKDITDTEVESEECGVIPELILRSESHVIFDKTILSNIDITLADTIPSSSPPKLSSTHKDVLSNSEWSKDLLDNIEITDLVASSQKLLDSVNKTLKRSEAVMCNISCIDNEGVPANSEKVEQCVKNETVAPGEVTRRKRSSSNLSRSRMDRRFSSDDIFESRCRTASSSLDRGAQWSRLASMIDPPRRRLPEATIRLWAAELLIAIETLHRWGVICKDLNPDNILLGDEGHLLLTYQSYWQSVDVVISERAVETYCAAPETQQVFPVTPAADWWSYGVLLYQLVTGQTLAEAHPIGIHSHTILDIPEFVSNEANSLITELLRYNANERLGSGTNGSEDVKNHPFFKTTDWESVYDVGVLI